LIQRTETLSLRQVDDTADANAVVGDADDDEFTPKRAAAVAEPVSALEHFESAVEKERQGKLGDSLSHYRKAYRLDAKVDQSYRNKHFPVKAAKPPSTTTADPNSSSNAPAAVPATANQPPSKEAPPEVLPMAQLIDTFAHSQITGAPPLIEGDRPPPCGISKLPTEVLLELLRHVAVRDPAMFVRLSLVCKKLAYHVWTDNGIWKRVALGPEFGLAAQRYNFATDLQGRELIFRTLGHEFDDDDEDDEDENTSSPSSVTEASFPPETVWRDVFHLHPRIRFTGVYISTVNYTRPGGSSATANTWSNPIHIVTYYRYLRFFRDGTCISLLTTHEPIEVVHYLTRENLAFVRTSKKEPAPTATILKGDGASASTSAVAPPPSVQQVMKHALRGRWRLCHPSLEAADINAGGAQAQLINPTPLSPGDLHIETEGAGPRYMYTMHLSLRSAGSARTKHTTKNNKLQWKGFWSYNLLTTDWAEFHLRNDKPFYFSRVKGYGLGY
jgi:F-box protein 9